MKTGWISEGSVIVMVEKTVDERESLGSRERVIRERVGDPREKLRRISESGVTSESLPRSSEPSLVDRFLVGGGGNLNSMIREYVLSRDLFSD